MSVETPASTLMPSHLPLAQNGPGDATDESPVGSDTQASAHRVELRNVMRCNGPLHGFPRVA